MKRTPLRSRRDAARDRRAEPGFDTWHTPVWGRCQSCGARGLLLRHHVVLEQHVRASGGDPWDIANSMSLGYFACSCHRDHHHAVRRLPLSQVPDVAIAFAVDLLGEHAAAEYLRRYYRSDDAV